MIRWIGTAALVLSSCGAKPPAIRVAHLPPSNKDLIEAMLAKQSAALSVSPTCHNVGTEPSDATIGRYLAGFMAEMASPDKKNWIEVVRNAGASDRGEPVWICDFTLRHADGDDRWGWGVRFQVRQSDGLVLAESFTCTGAG